jgi:hypothetical protein
MLLSSVMEVDGTEGGDGVSSGAEDGDDCPMIGEGCCMFSKGWAVVGLSELAASPVITKDRSRRAGHLSFISGVGYRRFVQICIKRFARLLGCL